MTENSPLRRLIQQQRTTALGKARVQAAERESELSIGNEIPGWERAKRCLDEAIQQANADYAAEAIANEFKYEDRPQPGLGNSVYAVDCAHGSTEPSELILRNWHRRTTRWQSDGLSGRL